MNLTSAQAVQFTEQTERVCALLRKLTRKLLQFGMHLEMVRLKLGLFIEGLMAGLTCVPWMHDAIMLLPFLFTVECFATYFTFILILSHVIFSFQHLRFILKMQISADLSVLCLTKACKSCYRSVNAQRCNCISHEHAQRRAESKLYKALPVIPYAKNWEKSRAKNHHQDYNKVTLFRRP